MIFLESMFSTLFLSALVWVASGEIGERTGWRKVYIALLLGPLGGVLLYKVGFMPTPADAAGWNIGFAAFMGLCASFAAKLWADAVGDRVKNLFSR